MEQPIEIFCCTADKDQHYLDEIKMHFRSLRKENIKLWDKADIPAGSSRSEAIEQHLQSAHIFLLLISTEFLASEYCYGLVTKKALERQVAGNARVIPVIVRNASWQNDELLKDLAMLPKEENKRPIDKQSFADRNTLFGEVVQTIVEYIQRMPPTPLPPTLPPPTPLPPTPPPPVRRGGNILIIIAVILIVAIVAGVLATIAIKQSQSQAQATATTQASLKETAQAQAAAQQKIQAYANATEAARAATATATTPSVRITSPTNGSTVDQITLVRGTVSNILNGEELWVIVVPGGVSAYYPQQGPVVITGNEWSASAAVGDTSSHNHGLGFTLIIALADQNGSAVIRAYLDQVNKTGLYPGIPSLPDGVFPKDQVHVIRK